MVIEEGPYTLTLVSVDNDDGDSFADLTSTLEVMVDDIANRTNISCVIPGNQTHLVIYTISELTNKDHFRLCDSLYDFCRSIISSIYCDGEDKEFPTR